MGSKSKIDWTDASWNPVTGCNRGCPYCYARRIASRFSGFDETNELNQSLYGALRFAGQTVYEVDGPMKRRTKDGDTETAPYPFGFAPTFYPYKLSELNSWETPRDVFVCSMGDLFADCIPDSWIFYVLYACYKNQRHRYFFLTKNPGRYVDIFENPKMITETEGLWFGTTITKPSDEFMFNSRADCFLSIEPIQEDFPPECDFLKGGGIKWVIVGAETGNRVGKVNPKREWIEHIAETCRKNDVPLFMKDSLRSLMGVDFVQEKP